jgi:hypothetical protein
MERLDEIMNGKNGGISSRSIKELEEKSAALKATESINVKSSSAVDDKRMRLAKLIRESSGKKNAADKMPKVGTLKAPQNQHTDKPNIYSANAQITVSKQTSVSLANNKRPRVDIGKSNSDTVSPSWNQYEIKDKERKGVIGLSFVKKADIGSNQLKTKDSTDFSGRFVKRPRGQEHEDVNRNRDGKRRKTDNSNPPQSNENKNFEYATHRHNTSNGGRGRGSDVNKPAWMNGQESNASRDNYAPLPISGKQNLVPHAPDGRGRGKDLNKPAWMSRDENNSISENRFVIGSITSSNKANTATSLVREGHEQGIGNSCGANVPAWMAKQQQSKATSITGNLHNNQVTTKLGSGNVDVGRGRGRGKDANKPAWMTRQESSYSFVDAPRNPGAVENTHMNHSKMAAQGRGKNDNRPAWMTKQEQSNNRPHQSQNVDSRHIRGLGRGIDANKPAWMTKQEQSNNRPVEPVVRSHNNNVDSRNTRGRGRDMNKPAWMTRQSSAR